jgi:hypothetical protein
MELYETAMVGLGSFSVGLLYVSSALSRRKTDIESTQTRSEDVSKVPPFRWYLFDFSANVRESLDTNVTVDDFLGVTSRNNIRRCANSRKK